MRDMYPLVYLAGVKFFTQIYGCIYHDSLKTSETHLTFSICIFALGQVHRKENIYSWYGCGVSEVVTLSQV